MFISRGLLYFFIAFFILLNVIQILFFAVPSLGGKITRVWTDALSYTGSSEQPSCLNDLKLIEANLEKARKTGKKFNIKSFKDPKWQRVFVYSTIGYSILLYCTTLIAVYFNRACLLLALLCLHFVITFLQGATLVQNSINTSIIQLCPALFGIKVATAAVSLIVFILLCIFTHRLRLRGKEIEEEEATSELSS